MITRLTSGSTAYNPLDVFADALKRIPESFIQAISDGSVDPKVMGFRTLALEQQASEVWKVLGAVKTEFERYGTWVEKVREQVRKASDTLDTADTRTKQMRRALKVVEALPDAQAQALLPPATEGDDALA